MSRALAITVSALAAVAFPAMAQDPVDQTGSAATDWRVDVGAAVIAAPRYAGSDKTRVRALPYVEAAYRDLVLAAVRDGRARLDVTPFRADGFYLGGEISFLFPQDETEARLPSGFGDIDVTPDVGVVAGFETRAFQVEGRVRQAVGGHDGATAQLEASMRFPVPGTLQSGRPTIVAIGPQVTWGDDRYAESFFGIDAGRAQRTGLRRYNPRDAVTYGGSIAVVRPLWRQLTLVAVGSVSRLTGDAADSPIVLERTNYSAVVAVAWRFQR